MQEAEQVIKVQGVTKVFGSVRALDALDLTVRKGEVHGFLGPNGAGKSTTIRVLLGLLRKSAGEVQVLGGDPWSDAVALHKRLAYIPGEVNLWPNLTGGEAIDILTKLRGNGIDTQRRAELLDRFELDPAKKIRTYSKGNRQKVAIIAALVSNVELYFMDEPTSGLDPLLEMKFQQTVKELKDEGKTVLLSSHILAEVEALCDRVSIIREGKIVESGTLAELRHLTRTSVTVVAKRTIEGLDGIDGVYDIEADGERVTFEVDAAALNNVLQHVAKYDVQEFISQPPTLEELFMRHYGDELTPQEKAVENEE